VEQQEEEIQCLQKTRKEKRNLEQQWRIWSQVWSGEAPLDLIGE
jgi:hypothetical protein